MAESTITLQDGTSFRCKDDVYILDAAEEQGVDFPTPAKLEPAAHAQAN